METNSTQVDPSRLDPVPVRPARPSRRRWLALLAIPIAAGALSLSVARAQGFGGGGGGGAHFMKERMEHLLAAAGASDAQKAQIRTIWQGLRPQIRPLRLEERQLRHQIGEAIAAPTIDQAKIEQLRRQSMQTLDKLSALVTQGMTSSAAVLTPAQRQAVLQQMEQHQRHGGAGAGPDADAED